MSENIPGGCALAERRAYPLLNQLYLEIKINLRTIGVVVDYERQRFRVNHTNDYIEFDLSVKSIYGRKGDLLAEGLDMQGTSGFEACHYDL